MMQGSHKVGSSRTLRLQLPIPVASSTEPSHTNLPLPAGSSQQPKQSQPLGVSGPQNCVQVSDCIALSSSQLEPVPGVLAFGSYLQSPIGSGWPGSVCSFGSHSWF